MDFPQQREVPFLGNPFHAADEPRNVAAFPAPQRLPPPAPLFDRDRRPSPGQPRGHGGVLQDAIFRPNEGREDMPQAPPVENIPAQAQPQDLQYVDMGHYDMAYDYPPPQGHLDHIICNNTRIVQDVPAQAHVAPPAPEIDAFNYEIQQAVAGPAPAILDQLPHQYHVPNGRATEVLRQLALVYLNDPHSQLVTIRMGPGHESHDTEVMVNITLKLTNL